MDPGENNKLFALKNDSAIAEGSTHHRVWRHSLIKFPIIAHNTNAKKKKCCFVLEAAPFYVRPLNTYN